MVHLVQCILMTRSTGQAGEFLEYLSSDEMKSDIDSLLAEESYTWLERINTRIDFANSGKCILVCQITSNDSAMQRYAKWQALQLYLADNPELLERYYQAQPYTPYAGGDDYVSEQIKNGEMDPSNVHLWEFGIQDPASGYQYYFKHLPGEDNKGWAYRFSVIK